MLGIGRWRVTTAPEIFVGMLFGAAIPMIRRLVARIDAKLFVAVLNADMIGRNAESLLYVIGPLSAPNGQSQRFGAILDSVNAALTPPFDISREWDSPTHPEHFYERSDHFNYARKGIPIVFLTSGLHDDYHKVSDDARKIDFAKMTRVTRLLVELGRAVANSPRRPR